MPDKNKELYEFDKYRLDVFERLLWRGPDKIPLPEKAFEVLCLLVRRANHLVGKDELLAEVWTDAIVEENNLDKNISILRRVLGERESERKFIETVRGHGYRFAAEVRVPETGIKSLAILPFKSLFAENRNEALELGIADSLILKISGSTEIIVRPLSAVRRYVSLETDSLAAGRELEVETVLEGSFQMAGDRIRISTHLFRTSDGRQVWNGQFDEKFTDIFALQDSISEKTAAALKVQFSNRRKNRGTKNVEAYQFYMKGRYQVAKITPSEMQKGTGHFQQAIEIDPTYALAYTGLSEAYRQITLAGEVPSAELFPKAKAAANKAVEIDDGFAEAHAALGSIIFWYDWDWNEAELLCTRALKLDPNSADAHWIYAHLLSNTGRHAEALSEIRRARELDPLSLFVNALEGQFLLNAGKTNEALTVLQKTSELEPNYWLTYLFAASAYIEKEMFAEAVMNARKAGKPSVASTHPAALESYALAKSGKRAEARDILEKILKMSIERYVSPYHIALIYNGLNDHEKTLSMLERGYKDRDPKMTFLKVEPKWNNLRNEPRFIELMRRMNFE